MENLNEMLHQKVCLQEKQTAIGGPKNVIFVRFTESADQAVRVDPKAFGSVSFLSYNDWFFGWFLR